MNFSMPTPALSTLLRRFALLALLAFAVTAAAWLYIQGSGPHAPEYIPPPPFDPARDTHPIVQLMHEAETEWHKLLSKETLEIHLAAEAYRERRGRHPPPGFDKWFHYSQKHNAVIVEDFFDQIYHDLNPFWGLDAATIRRQASHFEFAVKIRNGTATYVSDGRDRPWMVLWHNLTSTVAEYLPDIDIPINVMDESRIVVPWEDINEYMKAEAKTRKLTPVSKVLTDYSGLPDPDDDPGESFSPEWHTNHPYWDHVRIGCSPDSPSRNLEPVSDLTGPPPMPTGFPEYSFKGYVHNWTLNKDPCVQPELRESHGTFIEPLSLSTTKQLFPLFGGSKLPMNNEILLPPAMYWTDDEFYSGGEDNHGPAWEHKLDKVMWRGDASGGRNKIDNWTRFQRHRLIAMLNGTAVQLAEKSVEHAAHNFVVQPYTTYRLTATRHTDLGEWLKSFVNAGFVNLICFPSTGNDHCDYTDSYYELMKRMPMKEQYVFKYLPDVDGNSFSGRYRGFLRSTSVPIKATIYNEWHDSRLVPWLHFAPMHNSFVDVYGILDYFIGYNGIGAHDDAARKIALSGKSWAEKVLRREDMKIYVFRLFLEYARICDDQREWLGYVEDLL